MDEPQCRSARVRRRFQRGAFAVLYRHGGPIYDALTRVLFGDAWSRWRLTVVPLLGEGRVLDLGCGTGVLVQQLITTGFDTVGVDREPSMLRRAAVFSHVRGRLIRADATSLPFPDRSFANVVSTFPATFIVNPATLSEIGRVLAPGGVFAVVMSGETTESPRCRAPIRLALRLFYGDMRTSELPDAALLAAPGLSGEWCRITRGADRALIWRAVREND